MAKLCTRRVHGGLQALVATAVICMRQASFLLGMMHLKERGVMRLRIACISDCVSSQRGARSPARYATWRENA